MNRYLVLFDGECALCSGTVQQLLAWDRERRLRFAPIQGETARGIFERQGMKGDALGGIWLVERWGEAGERLCSQSDAILGIFGVLGGWWPILTLFRWLPRRWRDELYGFVARNRYRWFGKVKKCGIGDGEGRILP
ncbi:MAG: hypothetical protein B9S32_17325 [Verrucomicrobia bacterium Tous-C9LFEB]|nr:MAG: hypothetical protein B9S32_17325 [Verrucomicrobia bacterium Tous-C9LFEB]